ncbi:MAG TPA: DNA repair protein RecN [candidate division Zixibacteria bacterium]|nr:DNA repair protein RecN [candidate division Zixibacteria bacterium]
MLTSLHIENIALAENVTLEFEAGLSVLTGETGAGKSIIVNALALAMGDRADREYVRHGAEEARVEACFNISHLSKSLQRQLSEYCENGRILISRTISSEGGSQSSINGRRSTVAQIKEATAPFVEIVGQHANQALMDESNHLSFLDRFGSLDSLAEEVAEDFRKWQSNRTKLEHLRNRRAQLHQERELLLFQKKEIESAQIRIGEEQELLTERKVLDSARFLMESAAQIGEALDGEELSVIGQVGMIYKLLDDMARIDPSLESQSSELYDIQVRLEELRREVEQYGGSVEDNPERIEQVNSRLDELYELKKKYGGSEDAVLQTLEAIKHKLTDRVDVDQAIDSLAAEVDRQWLEFCERARELRIKRIAVAGSLQAEVEKELTELAIKEARFEIEFVEEIDESGGVYIDGRALKPSESGLETVRFRFSANPGEPARSLVKVASGGEISRVLLAIKSAELKQRGKNQPVLLFDEIDAGIGGQTALHLAEKLKSLANRAQLLVVTHLHQIARLADQHYAIEKKETRSGRNIIAVRRLSGPEITGELDRMIALPTT